MRNLKKVLSLVLAVAMMVSICVVGAGAVNYDDFKDEGTITKKQAVETLVSLDVLNGYNGGETFAPTQPVTRAEMATIICRILAGGESLIPDATKEIPTYADIDGHWAESYIEYCTSLGIVSGKGNGIFDPQANVTAAEAAKMVMTTLGYNADIEGFKGAGWDINTMAKANTLKLTDNLVSEISANNAITREQVAQLIYNALSTPVVQNYTGTVANTWISSGKDAYQETLLETKFNAQKITGVVIANEYADLYGAKPIKKGTTELALMDGDHDLTGETKTFNVSTTLDEIGESIIVYWNDTTKKVVYGDFQDTGLNVVTEFTAETKDITKGEGSVELAKDVEYFLNYGIGTKATSEYKITYVYTDADNKEVEVAIRPGKDITSADIAMMQEIFAGADKKGDEWIEGEVYVGTQSNKDVSDTMSWNDFEDEYLEYEVDNEKIVKNENGNYIKAVDFNNDGEVDYVLKTVYTNTDVEKVSKKGDITLATQDDDLDDPDDINMLTSKTDIATDDELVTGDIVVYAVIDGTAYVYLCDMQTAKIDKVNRNKLIATTEDGDEYEQSGITELIEDDEFESGVKNLAGKTSYDLYFDRYGYLVAFTQTATSGDFTLLLDGWYNETRTADEFAVLAYLDDEIVDTDVTSKSAKLFINSDANTQNNSWGNLKDFEDISTNTIVASLSEDGVLTPVEEVYNKKTVNIIAIDEDKIPGKAYTGGTAYYTGSAPTAYDTLGVSKNNANSDVEVRALSSTVYYYVYGSGKNAVVKTYVGYANAPAIQKNDKVLDVYAVGTMTDRDNDLGEKTYYTANVVVVEFKGSYRANAEQVFIYDVPEVGKNVKIENVDVIRKDGTTANVAIDFSKSTTTSGNNTYDPAYGKRTAPGLYWMWETKDEGVYEIAPMSHEEIADNRYTVGQVITTDGTGKEDYTEIQAYTYFGANKADFDKTLVAGETPEYKITADSALYTLSYSEDRDGDYVADLKADDMDVVLAETVDESRKDDPTHDTHKTNAKGEVTYYNYNDVLVSYNKDGEIVYAISFANFDDKTDNFAQAVWNNAKPAELKIAAPVVTFYGETAKADQTTTVTWTEATEWMAAEGNKALKVTNGDANLAEKDFEISKTADQTYNLSVKGDDGEWYEYTLKQNKASNQAALTGDYVDADDTDLLTLPDDAMRIQAYLDTFTKDDDLATVEWTIKLRGETPVSFTGMTVPATIANDATTDTIEEISAVVTAENGETKAEYSNVAEVAPTTAKLTYNGKTTEEDIGAQVNLKGMSKRVHTYYTISDAEGNFYKADGTKCTDAEVLVGTQYLLAVGNKTITMPAVDVTVTTGYAAASITLDGNVVTVYAQAGEEVTVTGRNDNGNTGTLRGSNIALTDNEGNVTYAPVDTTGATPTATFEMPATGVASYIDNIYVVTVVPGPNSANVQVSIDGTALENNTGYFNANANSKLTITTTNADFFTFAGETYGADTTNGKVLTIDLDENRDFTVTLG